MKRTLETETSYIQSTVDSLDAVYTIITPTNDDAALSRTCSLLWDCMDALAVHGVTTDDTIEQVHAKQLEAWKEYTYMWWQEHEKLLGHWSTHVEPASPAWLEQRNKHQQQCTRIAWRVWQCTVLEKPRLQPEALVEYMKAIAKVRAPRERREKELQHA